MSQMQCHQRGGAGGVGGDARPLKAEHIRDSPDQEAQAVACDGIRIAVCDSLQAAIRLSQPFKATIRIYFKS